VLARWLPILRWLYLLVFFQNPSTKQPAPQPLPKAGAFNGGRLCCNCGLDFAVPPEMALDAGPRAVVAKPVSLRPSPPSTHANGNGCKLDGP
jgi:hypothetical protein